MTKEIKASLILDQYDEKKEALQAQYDENYATKDSTPESTIALNMWFVEEDEKLKKWLITELKNVFEGA